jgi:hypothetical protein
MKIVCVCFTVLHRQSSISSFCFFNFVNIQSFFLFIFFVFLRFSEGLMSIVASYGELSASPGSEIGEGFVAATFSMPADVVVHGMLLFNMQNDHFSLLLE